MVTKEQVGKAVMLCWSIWRAHNDVVWKHKNPSIGRVVTSAKAYLKQWTCAQDKEQITPLPGSSPSDGAMQWVKPQLNTTKLANLVLVWQLEILQVLLFEREFAVRKE